MIDSMRFLGIDLAWSDTAAANETGAVALDPNGRILAAGWTVGVAETVTWVVEQADDDTSVFIDAPLMVLNPDKQRRCETQVGQRYGRWKVAANSTNLASPRLAGLAIRGQLEALGWTYQDGSAGPPSGGRTISECYPYTTLVGAPELGYDVERPLYKRKPKRLSTAEWRPIRAAACDELIDRLATLVDASPGIDLRSHPVTRQLLAEPSPLSDRDYKHREDLIDACLAAWSAALWRTMGFARCQVLGIDDPVVGENGKRATIIAPARDSQRVAPVIGP
jgi:predicted RNase H-like nuclease